MSISQREGGFGARATEIGSRDVILQDDPENPSSVSNQMFILQIVSVIFGRGWTCDMPQVEDDSVTMWRGYCSGLWLVNAETTSGQSLTRMNRRQTGRSASRLGPRLVVWEKILPVLDEPICWGHCGEKELRSKFWHSTVYNNVSCRQTVHSP